MTTQSDNVRIDLPHSQHDRRLLARVLTRIWYRDTDDGYHWRILIRKKGCRDEGRYCKTFHEAVTMLFRMTPGCEKFTVSVLEDKQ